MDINQESGMDINGPNAEVLAFAVLCSALLATARLAKNRPGRQPLPPKRLINSTPNNEPSTFWRV